MKTASPRVQDLFKNFTNKQCNESDLNYQLTIIQEKPSNFIKSLIGTHNTYIKITGRSHEVLIDYNKALKEIGNVLKKYMNDEWRKQECEVYIPALINKEIDTIAKNSGEKISSLQKDSIRRKVLENTYLASQFKNAGNLKAAAQTSIGQTTATYLINDSSLKSFFKAEAISRELQAEITAAITSKIADSVYKKVTGQPVQKIREIVQQEARRVLNPPKKVVIDMTNVLARTSIS